MELDDLLARYFGSADPHDTSDAARVAGIDRMRVDLGLEKDRGRRFSLWTLLYMLDAAPDLDVAFENAADRDAARTFMDMADEVSER